MTAVGAGNWIVVAVVEMGMLEEERVQEVLGKVQEIEEDEDVNKPVVEEVVEVTEENASTEDDAAAHVSVEEEDDTVVEVTGAVLVVAADLIEERMQLAAACLRCCTKASVTENRVGLTRDGELGALGQVSLPFATIFI